MKKGVFFISILVLISALFLLVACEDKNSLTGRITTPVSLLMISVFDEEGKPADGVEIFVNGQFKGVTSKFGQSRGSKTVVLDEENNLIQVVKEGYVTQKGTVSANPQGTQKVVFNLEKKKSVLLVEVLDNQIPLEGVRVALSQEKAPLPLRISSTDRDGLTYFEKTPDGNYTLRLSKEGYSPKTITGMVNFTADDGILTFTLNLEKEPKLKLIVLTEKEEPLFGAQVALYSKEGYNSPEGWPLVTETSNEEGEVEFRFVDEGTDYFVVVKKSGFTAHTLNFNYDRKHPHYSVVLETLE